MQCLLVVDGNLFPRIDITQSKEQHVPMDCAHIRIRCTRVIDVMRAIASAAAVDAPNAVDVANAQLSAMRAALRFAIRNALARVFGYLAPVWKMDSRKAALAVDWRFSDRESGCKFQVHLDE